MMIQRQAHMWSKYIHKVNYWSGSARLCSWHRVSGCSDNNWGFAIFHLSSANLYGKCIILFMIQGDCIVVFFLYDQDEL